MFPHSSLRKWLAIFVITLTWLPILDAAKKPDYRLDDDGSQSRKNELSREAIGALRAAFIGREFVLRINWNANHKIHDGQVRHEIETFESVSIQKRLSKGGLNYGPLVSPAGEVSRIVGLNAMHSTDLSLHFRTDRGTLGSLVVRSASRGKSSFEKWNDANLTVLWLESQLSNQAVRFLKEISPLVPEVVEATLPQAQSGLRLSSNPVDPHGTQREAIERRVSRFPTYLDRLSVRVEPPRVKKGDYARLVIEYAISGERSGGLEALESRYLDFEDNSLPGYPVIKTFNRDVGESESSYRQKIPLSAKSGVYYFRGKVEVNGESISRVARFTVID